MQLVISATNRCDLNCKHCLYNKRYKGEFTVEDAEIISTWDVSSVGIIGGEPFLNKNLDKIVDILLDSKKEVTIYTNGIRISKNPDIVIKGSKVNYIVSLDGWKENHEKFRGKGTFNKALSALEYLSTIKDEIGSLWIRMTYHMDNLRDLPILRQKAVELGVKIILYPLLGTRAPLPTKLQLELFKLSAKDEYLTVYVPAFWQFCGYKQSTCQAGLYRLFVDEFGVVHPCQWMEHEKIACIYDKDFDEIREVALNWRKMNIFVRKECIGCPRANACMGSCRLCPDYLTCPMKIKIDINRIFDKRTVIEVRNKYRRTFGTHKLIIC